MKVVSKDSDGNELTLFVRKPNAKDNREAKLYSNSVAAQIMLRKDSDGKPTFITRSQIITILRDSGRYSDKDQKHIDTLKEEIKELEDRLYKGGIKKSEGRELAITLRKKRNSLFLSLLAINELDEHTLEAEVENANFDYLVYLCSAKEDSTKLFTSVDDYKEKADSQPYAYEVADALKTLIYGTNEDLIKDNVENRFLIKHGYVDSKYRLINSDGHLIDIEGKKIDEDGRYVDEEDKVIEEVRSTELGEFLED